MKITVSAIGKIKNGSAEAQLIDNYIKRIPWQTNIYEYETKKKNKGEALKKEEAILLNSKLPASGKKIILDERGKLISSTELAKTVNNWQNDGISNISFLIGGADGHLEETKKNADMVLSLGKITLPHILARIILIEQIYRAHTINSGHPYHRE